MISYSHRGAFIHAYHIYKDGDELSFSHQYFLFGFAAATRLNKHSPVVGRSHSSISILNFDNINRGKGTRGGRGGRIPSAHTWFMIQRRRKGSGMESGMEFRLLCLYPKAANQGRDGGGVEALFFGVQCVLNNTQISIFLVVSYLFPGEAFSSSTSSRTSFLDLSSCKKKLCLLGPVAPSLPLACVSFPTNSISRGCFGAYKYTVAFMCNIPW